MNLYKLTQNENNTYDTYDSCLVAAKTEDRARSITPGSSDTWVSDLKYVDIEYIGKAKSGTKEGVIIASFNAG